MFLHRSFSSAFYEAVFCLKRKKTSSYRDEYRFPLFNLSVCLVCLCATFVFFSDCESCTRPISATPGYMEAGQNGGTRETWFVARRLRMVAVAELLWISRCFGCGGIFAFSMILRFKFEQMTSGYERPRAVRVDSVKGLRQPGNPPTEYSRPSLPTRCNI